MTKLLVATESELLTATEGSGQWQVDTQLAGMPIQCIAADPLQPTLAFCGTSGKGLWRSEDGGASWQHIGEGIAHTAVTALAVSRTERISRHGVVWAGTEPSALFRSDDGGKTWHEQPRLLDLPSKPTWSFPPRPETHHVRWIAPDAAQAGRIFACIERGGVMRSLDGGNTWEDRKPDGPLDVHTLRTHRFALGRVYAAAGDGFLTPGQGYAESSDGGATWQRLGTGLRQHYLWSLAVDPDNPETIVISAARGPGEAHNPQIADSTIYRRIVGEVWQESKLGLPESSGTIAPVLEVSEAEPGVFYMASNKGIFRSTDAGQTWQPLGIAWPDRFRREHVQGIVVID